jgi:hypothetical protein
MTELPNKWKQSEKSLRAVQLVFEFNRRIAENIRKKASAQGISTSDQIRKIVGLPVKTPQRPRLTVSLSADDYRLLGARYGLPPEDKNAIREAIVEELLKFGEAAQARDDGEER